MTKFINKFLDWVIEQIHKSSEVGQIDGIVLIDVRNRGGGFKTTIENSLQLIRQHDPRRYIRIKRYVSRIANAITPVRLTGQYNSKTRTVSLEFFEMRKRTDEERAAIYASVLIDNATRAVLRRFQKTKTSIDHSTIENQIRSAKLYADEHNRFLEKLVEADLLSFPTFKQFQIEFDEKRPPKTSGKKKNRLNTSFSMIWRAVTERKIKKK